MFNIYYNSCRDLKVCIFFNKVPFLFDALDPMSHNIQNKSFGLTDKPRMHRFLQLLAYG